MIDAFTVYDGGYHAPVTDRFPMVDISTVGMVLVLKRSAWEASRRELSEDLSFRDWHPHGCREVELGKSPHGCVTCTVLYGKVGLRSTQGV